MKFVSFSRDRRANLRAAIPTAVVAVAAGLLAACVVEPQRRTVMVPVPPPQRVFVYPASGQSPEQTARDRYECHTWAVGQTGFDPTIPGAYERVEVQPTSPTGSGTAVGAIGGALVGALIAGPGNAGAGMVLGGATGALMGSASDANAQQYHTQQQVNQSRAAGHARADTYRRALGACLQGRGYTIS